MSFSDGTSPYVSVPLSDGTDINLRVVTSYYPLTGTRYGLVTISEMVNTADYTTLPYVSGGSQPTVLFESSGSDGHERLSKILDFVISYTNIDINELCSYGIFIGSHQLMVHDVSNMSKLTWDYLYNSDLDLSLQAFGSEDPAGMYVLSLDGSLLDTTYTVGINRYTSEFEYLIDSYAYTDGSGSYTFTGSRNLSLPIFYNSFTNMPYSYEVSVNVNDENGYLDTRYLVYWSDLGGLYDTVPDPLVPTPTPTVTFVPPLLPVDMPDPDSLNNTVNITGWYQDQGFENNNITAPIYSGLRGFFSETLIPIYDFFLVPIGSLGTMITDSAGTSKDAIYDSVDQLTGYAAPMNMIGGYVVLLVPDVVWVVVFAALTIGYAVLLIRISTGSIRDTINRFLGGR